MSIICVYVYMYVCNVHTAPQDCGAEARLTGGLFIPLCICICMYTYIYTYIHIYVSLSLYIYIYIYICLFMVSSLNFNSHNFKLRVSSPILSKT